MMSGTSPSRYFARLVVVVAIVAGAAVSWACLPQGVTVQPTFSRATGQS